MTVAENMGFALKIAKKDKAEIRQRVEAAAKILDLTEYLDRKPKALSGGQRQRVAMGRAIVRQPQVFLMDEPLSNLDAKLRVQTRTQIAALQRRLGVTTVYVTHDQVEALTMGDRIAVMKDGVLQQVGTPRDMYDSPANVFVAGFIGSPAMNIGTYQVFDGFAQVGRGKVALSRETIAALKSEDKSQVVLGFRPEALDRAAPNADGAIPVEVDVVEELGSDAFVYGSVPTEYGGAKDIKFSAGESQVVVRLDPRDDPKKGETIWVTIRTGEQHVFSSASGLRLSAEPVISTKH
jgi:multiple sugar transport system ATP-binding protein